MFEVYQFSESSKGLLERCINIASQPDKKWLNLFKPDKESQTTQGAEIKKQESDSENTILYDAENDMHPLDSNIEVLQTDLKETTLLQDEHTAREQEKDYIKIRAFLEASLCSILEYLKEQCVNDDSILPYLAEELSPACVEKICCDLFSNEDGDVDFVTKFFKQFFPIYIKRECVEGKYVVAVELLEKVHKTYPDLIVPLLESLCADIEMPTKVLQDFCIIIDEATRTQFLQALTVKEFPTEAFATHINTISYLYESHLTMTSYMAITSKVQKFMFDGLTKCSERFREDKNYGRCLLTFFKGLKDSNTSLSKPALYHLVNNHETVFKKPCLSILNSLQ